MLSNLCAFRDALRPKAEGDEAETTALAAQRFGEASAAVIANIFQSSYMDNIAQMFDQEFSLSVLGKIPASFVPYSAFLRRLAQSIQSMETGKYVSYENTSFFSALANVLPWTNEEGTWLKKQGKLTALGEELSIRVSSPEASGLRRGVETLSQWLPLPISDVYTDPVEKELFDLQIYPGLPQKTMEIRGETVQFDDTFYREYALLYGKYVKEAFQTAMDSPTYSGLSAQRRRIILDRRQARAQLKARNAAKRAWVSSHKAE